MSDGLLSDEEYEEILKQLSPEAAQKLRDQREMLMKNLRQNAHIAIITQNLSHGAGHHVFG
jgi:ATP sulfurylase